MPGVELSQLLEGQGVFGEAECRYKDKVFQLKEVEVGPGLFGGAGEVVVQFLDMEAVVMELG